MNEDINTRAVLIDGDGVQLAGDLAVPDNARGVILFVHGSGSGRFSVRNRFVAQQMQKAGFATLLFDLLTAAEDREDRVTGLHRFDIELLTRRTVAATLWLAALPELAGSTIGYFGASTGAAAALVAASAHPECVSAVVSRGGRPDLAAHALPEVQAPTLLIVGGDDHQVIDLNRIAQRQLICHNRLEMIPGATHLFEEPGALENVVRLAGSWFGDFLPPAK